MRSAALLVSMLLVVTFAGCLTPFAPHVDAAALRAVRPTWEEVAGDSTSSGIFGPNTVETKYRHNSGNAAPFPGVLQIFGIRELDPRTSIELMAWTEEIVARALDAQNITVDEASQRTGERTLRSGLETRYFTVEGRVATGGELFAEDAMVRIIGEVGRDGYSNTGFVAVGLVQTARNVRNPVCTGPVLPSCDDGFTREADTATWRALVGDEAGTIDDAVDTNALLWNLITHD